MEQNPDYSTGNKPVRIPFQTIDKILPVEIYDLLSAPARRVYSGVWNVANWSRRNPIWIKDESILERAKVTPDVLSYAQHELLEANLVELLPGHNEMRWTIIDPDEPTL